MHGSTSQCHEDQQHDSGTQWDLLMVDFATVPAKVDWEGETHQENKRQAVDCLDCGRFVQRKHLKAHQQKQHGTNMCARWLFDDGHLFDLSHQEPMTYVINKANGTCRVPGCLGRPAIGDALCCHSLSRHHYHAVVITEESGETLFPWCASCFLQLAPCFINSAAHRHLKMCQQFQEQHLKQETVKAACLAVEVKFSCAGEELQPFTYLRKIVTKDGDDW